MKKTKEDWARLFERAYTLASEGKGRLETFKILGVTETSMYTAHKRKGFKWPKFPKGYSNKSRAPYTNGKFVTYAPTSDEKIEIISNDGKFKIAIAKTDEESLKTILRVLKEVNQ